MKSHLTRKQVNGWLIGDRAAEVRDHVAGCPECSARIAREEAPLTAFRAAVRGWSARRMNPAVAFRPRAAFSGWLRLAAAAAALAVMITAGMVDLHHRRAAAMARADEALLEQVDAEVARSVPPPLEPLAKLMSNSTQEGTAQ